MTDPDSKLSDNAVTADVLILGSGLAGMLLALELSRSGASVVVASKGLLSDSNTSYAQGGVAAVTSANALDSLDLHLSDTLKSGAGLTDAEVARTIIADGAPLIRRLRDLGVRFDVGISGVADLCREGGHSQPRVLHNRDTTGRAITGALVAMVESAPKVLTLQNVVACELLQADGRVVGARVLFNGRPTVVFAGRVVLATGGAGQLFDRTTNPSVATGDGVALAYRAGARLIDMEFMQFHPTALCKPDTPAFLISEAVRGAGAVVLDRAGDRFATRFHPDGELATRDIVARGIATIMHEEASDNVRLDLRPIGAVALKSRFPNIVESCRRFGIDALTEPVPVAPAAHYYMGGIWTDLTGLTSLPGLYAIGECASIGLHGANRLASNSLLEAGAMAMRLARAIENEAPRPLVRDVDLSMSPVTVPADLMLFRRRMYEDAGLKRDEGRLLSLLRAAEVSSVRALPSTRQVVEAASIHLVGTLMARAALERKETRGAQYRSDYPETDDNNFRKRLWISRDGSGWLDMPAANPVSAAASLAVSI